MEDLGPCLHLCALGIISTGRHDARHPESNDLSWSPKDWTAHSADLRSGRLGRRLFPVFAGAGVSSPHRRVEGASRLGPFLRVDVLRFACIKRKYRLAKVLCESPLDRGRFRRTRGVSRGSGCLLGSSATQHHRVRSRMVDRERVPFRSCGLAPSTSTHLGQQAVFGDSDFKVSCPFRLRSTAPLVGLRLVPLVGQEMSHRGEQESPELSQALIHRLEITFLQKPGKEGCVKSLASSWLCPLRRTKT